MADDAQFYVAKANFEAEDYPLAAVEFQILRADYPNSELFQQAYYLEGMCYVKQEPSLAVDPTVVEQGIAHFRRLLREYPNGEYSDEAREQLRSLQRHMDEKKLRAAELYQRLGETKAALVTVEAILQDNPESELGPNLLFMEGNLALELDDPSHAQRVWTELVQKYPDHQLARTAQRKLSKLSDSTGETSP
jgi:outer membrane protein assembly factor BamD